MALNKKGGLGKGLGKGIDSLISNAYAVEAKKKDSATADKKEPETTVKLHLRPDAKAGRDGRERGSTLRRRQQRGCGNGP